jgi:hypothetical protein
MPAYDAFISCVTLRISQSLPHYRLWFSRSASLGTNAGRYASFAMTPACRQRPWFQCPTVPRNILSVSAPRHTTGRSRAGALARSAANLGSS